MNRSIPLKQIRIDGGTQPREAINEAYIDELVEADPGSLPPGVVYFDGTDNWLADGFHRYFANEKAKKPEMVCEVRKGTHRDAVWYSLSANHKHGLRRTNEDKRRAVGTALSIPEWAKKSDRVLAKHIDVSHEFVRSMRPGQVSSVDTSTRTGADGKQHPAAKPRSAPPPPVETESQLPPPEPLGVVTSGVPEPVTSDATPDYTPGLAVLAGIVADARGTEIKDPAVAQVFKDGEAFKTARGLVQDLLKLVRGMKDQPVGAFLRIDQIEAHLSNARDVMKAAIPFAVCPYAPNCDHGCKCCKGAKWIPEQVWNAVPEEVKKAAA